MSFSTFTASFLGSSRNSPIRTRVVHDGAKTNQVRKQGVCSYHKSKRTACAIGCPHLGHDEFGNPTWFANNVKVRKAPSKRARKAEVVHRGVVKSSKKKLMKMPRSTRRSTCKTSDTSHSIYAVMPQYSNATTYLQPHASSLEYLDEISMEYGHGLESCEAVEWMPNDPILASNTPAKNPLLPIRPHSTVLCPGTSYAHYSKRLSLTPTSICAPKNHSAMSDHGIYLPLPSTLISTSHHILNDMMRVPPTTDSGFSTTNNMHFELASTHVSANSSATHHKPTPSYFSSSPQYHSDHPYLNEEAISRTFNTAICSTIDNCGYETHLDNGSLTPMMNDNTAMKDVYSAELEVYTPESIMTDMSFLDTNEYCDIDMSTIFDADEFEETSPSAFIYSAGLEEAESSSSPLFTDDVLLVESSPVAALCDEDASALLYYEESVFAMSGSDTSPSHTLFAHEVGTIQ